MNRRFLLQVRAMGILMAIIVGFSLTWNVYERMHNYPAGPFFGLDCHSREDHFTLERYDPAQMINSMVSPGDLANIDFCVPPALPMRQVEFKSRAYQPGGNDHSVIDYSITTDDTTVYYYVDKSSGPPTVRSIKMSPFLAAVLTCQLPFAHDPSRQDGELVRQTTSIDVPEMERRWFELTRVMTEFFSVKIDPIPGSLYTTEEVNALHKGLAPWLFCLTAAKINYETFEQIRQVSGANRNQDDEIIFRQNKEQVVAFLAQMENGWVDAWHYLAMPPEFDRLVIERNKCELGWLGRQAVVTLLMLCLAIFPKVALLPEFMYVAWRERQARRAVLAKEQAELAEKERATELARNDALSRKKARKQPVAPTVVPSSGGTRPHSATVVELSPSSREKLCEDARREAREKVQDELLDIASRYGVLYTMRCLFEKITTLKDLELLLNIIHLAEDHQGNRGVVEFVNFLREVKVPRDHINPQSATFKAVANRTFFSSRDEQLVAAEV